MKRATATKQPSSSECAAIRGKYASNDAFLQYKSTTLKTDELRAYVGSQLAADLKNQSNADAQRRLNENGTKLQTLEYELSSLQKCLQSDLLNDQDSSAKVYSLQKELDMAEKEADDTHTSVSEAKERANLLEKPYSKTNIWESWFPLGRPLRQESVPVLLSFAIVFLTLSLGMFLRLAGFSFIFQTPISRNGGFNLSLPFIS
jgi:chromosome segregation ATPase